MRFPPTVPSVFFRLSMVFGLCLSPKPPYAPHSFSRSMLFVQLLYVLLPRDFPNRSVPAHVCRPMSFFMASLIWFSQTSLLTHGVRNNRNPLASYNSMRLLQGQPEVQRAWTFYILSSLLRVFEKPIRGRLARRILFFSTFLSFFLFSSRFCYFLTAVLAFVAPGLSTGPRRAQGGPRESSGGDLVKSPGELRAQGGPRQGHGARETQGGLGVFVSDQ